MLPPHPIRQPLPGGDQCCLFWIFSHCAVLAGRPVGEHVFLRPRPDDERAVIEGDTFPAEEQLLQAIRV